MLNLILLVAADNADEPPTTTLIGVLISGIPEAHIPMELEVVCCVNVISRYPVVVDGITVMEVSVVVDTWKPLMPKLV